MKNIPRLSCVYSERYLMTSMERIIERYSDMLTRTSFTYVRNTQDAQDITQEVFIALLQQKKMNLEDDEHLKAWLLRVAINKSKNHLRSSWFRKKTPLSEELSYLPDEKMHLLEAVMSLPEKYRTPLHLHAYIGYSIKEIAKLLNKKEATIGTRLARAKNLLSQKIGEDHETK